MPIVKFYFELPRRRFATLKLYKATVNTFPGASNLFEGSVYFVSSLLILVLYFFVRRHERVYGPLGGQQNSHISKKTFMSEEDFDEGIEGDYKVNNQ